MDSFRRARKLYKAEETRRWMERRGITHHELEQLVSSLATTMKLRDKLVSSRVDEHFALHSGDFDIVHVARIALPDETDAMRLAERLRNGDVDFTVAAQTCFIGANPKRPAKSDFFVAMHRRDAAQEIRTSLFESTPGS